MCSDDPIFTTSENIEFEFSNFLSLGTTDEGAFWSLISSKASNIITSTDLAVMMEVSNGSTADIGFSLQKLRDQVSSQSSSLQSLLDSLFPSKYGSIQSFTGSLPQLNSSWHSLMDTELVEIISKIGASSSRWPMNSAAELQSYDDPFREAMKYLPNLALRILGSSISAISSNFNFSSFSDSKAFMDPYLPLNTGKMIDSLTMSFVDSVRSALDIARSNPNSAKKHLDCYISKLTDLRSRFNFSALLGSSNPLVGSNARVQQAYGLFSTDSANQCFNALLDEYFALPSSLQSLIIFDLDDISNVDYGANSTWRSVDRSNTSKITAWDRITSTQTAPLSFNTYYTPGVNVTGYSAGVGGLWWKFNETISFTTSLPQRRKSYDGDIDSRSESKYILAIDVNRESSLARDIPPPPCSPGYYASFNPVTGLFDCVGCPKGSYCIGTDGIQRLCSNGPINRVNYTQTMVTSADCPFVCSVPGECRSNNECVVPETGTYCGETQSVQLCPRSSFPHMWTYTSGCTASMQYLAYFSSADDRVDCTTQTTAKWCSFSAKFTLDFTLSFRLRLDSIPLHSTTYALFNSPGQYKIELVYNEANGGATFLISSGSRFSSLPFNLIPLTWIDVKISTSKRNNILIEIDGIPNVVAFFDASSLPGLNSGNILVAPYSATAPGMAMSNIAFTNLNETRYLSYLKNTPKNLRPLFCDLTDSVLSVNGVCDSKCPLGYNRIQVSESASACACVDATQCLDRSFASSASCASGSYLSWQGSYMMIDVDSGSAFISSLSLFNSEGKKISISSCASPLTHPSSIGCDLAYKDSSFQGWAVQGGSSSLFFLDFSKNGASYLPNIDSIKLKTRTYFATKVNFDDDPTTHAANENVLGGTISLTIYLSHSAFSVMNRKSETMIAKKWEIDTIPIGTQVSEEKQERLDVSKASFLASKNAWSPSWDSLSTCLSCPSSALFSLPPMLSIRDCVCSNGIVPGPLNGCEMVSLSYSNSSRRDHPTCASLASSVLPVYVSGIYGPLLPISFYSSEMQTISSIFGGSTPSPAPENTGETSNSPDHVFIDLQIKFSGQQTVQTISLALGDEIQITSSASVLYSVSIPGCPVVSSMPLTYTIIPRCQEASIAFSGADKTKQMVSIFGAPGMLIDYSLEGTQNAPSTPTVWKRYTEPFSASAGAIVRARATPMTEGICSQSHVARAVVPSSSSTSNQTNGPNSNASSKCGGLCIGLIVGTICFVVLIILALVIFIIVRNTKPKPAEPNQAELYVI